MNFTEGTMNGLYYNMVDITPAWVENPETIIFHHGVGANTEIWAEWIPILGMNYRIARFDMRGFGRSADLPSETLNFDMLSYDINLVASTLGIERFHLVGESIGGTSSLVYAINHPDRLHTLTLTNTAFRGEVIKNVNEWDDVLRKQGPEAWSKSMMSKRFYEDVEMSPDKLAWYQLQQASHPIDSIIVARDILVNTDLGPRLKEIKLPVLLMHADASPFISVDQMAEMHRLIDQAEYRVFNHSRHGLPFSHATECAHTMLKFLKRNQLNQ